MEILKLSRNFQSRAEAGTARFWAHSRKAAISSARVVESGTVCANAAISNSVVRAFFSDAKKANEVFTSDRNLYEEWRDQAALDEHYKTDHFIRFGVNGIRTLAVNRLAHRALPLE